MTKDPSLLWKQALRNGLIAGGIAILVSLVGLVEAFGDVYIISGLATLGELILLSPIFLFAYLSIRASSGKSLGTQAGISALIGLVAGIMLTLLVLVGSATNMRAMFVNASPALFNLLTRGVPSGSGIDKFSFPKWNRSSLAWFLRRVSLPTWMNPMTFSSRACSIAVPLPRAKPRGFR